MGIWFKDYSTEQLQDFSKQSLNENLGIEFLSIGEDSIEAKMPVDDRTVQPFRILHGGASAALAETLGSVSSMMCINTDTHIPVGLELNINHLRSETNGFVVGKCTPIHLGRSTHVWSIEITSEKGKKVAVSRLTVMILDRK